MNRITKQFFLDRLDNQTEIDAGTSLYLSKILRVSHGDVGIELEGQSDDVQEKGLVALANVIARLDALDDEAFEALRFTLRNFPSLLLQTLADNLENGPVAKAAAFALVASFNPCAYKDRLPAKNQRQVLFDLERLFARNQIGCFSKADIKSQDGNCITVVAQLWNGMPFKLDGRTVRLAPIDWLQKDTNSKLTIEVIGATSKNSKIIAPHLSGQLACAEQESELAEAAQNIRIYLRCDDRIFDCFTLRARPASHSASRKAINTSSLLTKSL